MKGSPANKNPKRKPIKSIGHCEENSYVKFDRGQFLGQDKDFLGVRKLARESLEKFKYLLESETEQEPKQK